MTRNVSRRPARTATAPGAMQAPVRKVDGPPEADPAGLAAALAAQKAAGGNTVILFGSRARGDHREDSDIDLLIVYEGISREGQARRAVARHFAGNPPALGVDIITMRREDFEYCRRAPNHVAGQAARDGIAMNGEELERPVNNQDDYPDNWPDTQARILAARRNLRALETILRELPHDHQTWGQHAQEAVLNALRAWASAAEIKYRERDGISELASYILEHPAEGRSPRRQAAQGVHPVLHVPGPRGPWGEPELARSLPETRPPRDGEAPPRGRRRQRRSGGDHPGRPGLHDPRPQTQRDGRRGPRLGESRAACDTLQTEKTSRR